MRDYYSRLIDGMRAEKGRLRSGGDGSDGDSMSAKGSPPVETTLALFSGIVTVGADGVAQVPLQIAGLQRHGAPLGRGLERRQGRRRRRRT